MAFVNKPLTPFCVVNYDIAKRNAEKMLARSLQFGCQFRPHVKTHKTVEGTLLMTGGRRSKIIVSTISELHFFINAGFDDIIYAIPIAQNRIETIASLLKDGKDVKIFCDDISQYEMLVNFKNEHKQYHSVKFSILLMIAYSDNSSDSKKHQIGLDPYCEKSLEFAKKIHQGDIAHYKGVYIHAGHSYYAKGQDEIKHYMENERKCAVDFAQRLKVSYDIDSNHVSMGSTPTTSVDLESNLSGITEIHAGNYLMFDIMQRNIGACETEDIALTIHSQVISVYEEQNTLLIDLGWTGTSAQGSDCGYGEILSHSELKINSLKQETGEVVPKDLDHQITKERYPIGTIIILASYHACASLHQYDKVYVEKDGKIVDEWKRSPAH